MGRCWLCVLLCLLRLRNIKVILQSKERLKCLIVVFDVSFDGLATTGYHYRRQAILGIWLLQNLVARDQNAVRQVLHYFVLLIDHVIKALVGAEVLL